MDLDEIFVGDYDCLPDFRYFEIVMKEKISDQDLSIAVERVLTKLKGVEALYESQMTLLKSLGKDFKN